MPSKICVVILNYNGWKDTIECLESVLGNEYPGLRVIAVDNGSDDGSLERMMKWADGNPAPEPGRAGPLGSPGFLPKPLHYAVLDEAEAPGEKHAAARLLFIKSSFNRGFSGGNNLAIRFALDNGGFSHIWLLNNDTVVPKDAVSRMAAFLEAQKQKGVKAGISGTIQLYYDRPGIIQAAAGGFNKWKGAFVNLGEGRKYGEYVPDKFGYVYGASMVLDADFIRSEGLLCEDYFMYYEEIDLAERAVKSGWKISIAADVCVYHKHGASTAKTGSGLRTYYLERNKAVFYRKYHPFLLPVMMLFQLKNFIFSSQKAAFLKGFFDGLFYRWRGRKLLIMEFNDHHEEVIKPLVSLLGTEYEIHVHANEAICGRDIIEGCALTIVGRGKLRKLAAVLRLYFYILKKGIGTVIYNTYGDKYARLLDFILPKSIKRAAVLHNADLLEKKARVKDFLVLSEELRNVAGGIFPEYCFEYFYPLIYDGPEPDKTRGRELRICVPGRLEYSRRDYAGILDFAAKNPGINAVKFILLGDSQKNDGPAITEKAAGSGVAERFEFFKGFINYKDFFAVLAGCDAVMPLIYPEGGRYGRYKISAAFNMAFSFKKPLLMHSGFMGSAEYSDFSIFYDPKNIGAMFVDAGDFRRRADEISEKIKKSPKFGLYVQKQRLAGFLGKAGCGHSEKARGRPLSR